MVAHYLYYVTNLKLYANSFETEVLDQFLVRPSPRHIVLRRVKYTSCLSLPTKFYKHLV
jgi:hypothetical protein